MPWDYQINTTNNRVLRTRLFKLLIDNNWYHGHHGIRDMSKEKIVEKLVSEYEQYPVVCFLFSSKHFSGNIIIGSEFGKLISFKLLKRKILERK